MPWDVLGMPTTAATDLVDDLCVVERLVELFGCWQQDCLETQEGRPAELLLQCCTAAAGCLWVCCVWVDPAAGAPDDLWVSTAAATGGAHQRMVWCGVWPEEVHVRRAEGLTASLTKAAPRLAVGLHAGECVYNSRLYSSNKVVTMLGCSTLGQLNSKLPLLALQEAQGHLLCF